jgi:glycosyltransferase involved in cell wall biosynthesis
LNAEQSLAATLTALVPAAVEGVVRQVIVVDGGSTDRTLHIAEQAGAEIVPSDRGRGRQLMAGRGQARFPWLLFLHADTVLEGGWEREAATFMERVEIGQRPLSAAAFRFALDDLGVTPRLIETGVALRCALLRLPYGDQGLLLPTRLYDEIGGFRPMPLMEDVELIRRLGRRRTVVLRAAAVTSAAKFKRDGYLLRVSRNVSCLLLYYLRAPMPVIERMYGTASGKR